MNLSQMLQATHDFFRPNRYGLKKYLLRDGEKHPVALICPGGAYRIVCSFFEGVPCARALNERGYHAFVVYNRVKKKARYPAPQDDLEHAIRDVFAHAEEWKLDTRCWSLWGSSAGGHMAASLCQEKRDVPVPGVLVLSYPVVTMGEKTHPESREHLLGDDAAPEDVARLSVEQHITPNFPPTYLWCGTADRTVDPENSRMLAAALEMNGVPHMYEELEGIRHGVGLGKGLPWFDHAVEFWESIRENESSGGAGVSRASAPGIHRASSR